MSQKKLVIISVDALNAQDYELIRTLPTFRMFFDQGAHVRKVSSVYPTVTYTCHTSITTGHYPDIHKIFNNEYPQPEKATSQDWRWFDKNIKAPTLFDYAKQNGLTVGCILWPVMAGADIDWNVPEIWAPDDSISGARLLWQYGTRNAFLPAVFRSHLMKGKKQPQLDNFTESMAAWLLQKKQPDITAIHFTELDTIRHINGLHSKEANHSLKNIDKRIRRLIEITKKNGTFNHTNFILLGDHGTHDFERVIEVNSYLEDKGFLTTDGDGKILTWEAYGCTCGGSCQIHACDTLGKERIRELEETLAELAAPVDSPVKSLITKEVAMKEWRLNGDFHLILEAADGYAFRNSVSGNLTRPGKEIPNRYKGDHGYMPEHRDMATMLLMMGPDIKKAAVLEHCSLVDEGPTFAKLMGLTMEKTDGHILSDLLKQ